MIKEFGSWMAISTQAIFGIACGGISILVIVGAVWWFDLLQRHQEQCRRKNRHTSNNSSVDNNNTLASHDATNDNASHHSGVREEDREGLELRETITPERENLAQI